MARTGADGTEEGRLREQYGSLARRAIAQAVDPASPDFLNFTSDRQPLVDAAFLGQALLRAPKTLRDGLDDATKRHLIAALESSRVIVPNYNNWLLFTATVEAALKQLGARWDRLRVDYAVRQHEQWYKGDGAYGDGADFHWDYYNSFVIHPMLLDVLDACADENPAWKSLIPRVQQRARRYAAVQERLIAPDGSFPAFGRSLAYRFGAFHLLAQMALRHGLPDGVTPAQVRGALTAIIRRSIEAPGTFDAGGWLQIGFCGHQPGVGETYISTGSLYLCSVGLLPLGLAATDDFWSAAPNPGHPRAPGQARPFRSIMRSDRFSGFCRFSGSRVLVPGFSGSRVLGFSGSQGSTKLSTSKPTNQEPKNQEPENREPRSREPKNRTREPENPQNSRT